MKTVSRVFDMDIVNFAGCFKIYQNGQDVGGIYATRKEAEGATIEMKRDYLGIKIERRAQ